MKKSPITEYNDTTFWLKCAQNWFLWWETILSLFEELKWVQRGLKDCSHHGEHPILSQQVYNLQNLCTKYHESVIIVSIE